ncbi:hypothetical protein TKK_0010062 [Trichogramma kaykai]|uniref:Uncharacterized protein n=1 Tax=Trichogramma kaykai TaxID=54128 RepID=A0ABD2WZP9_9HYME
MSKSKKYFVCAKFDDDRLNKHCVSTKYVYYKKNDASPINPKDEQDYKENHKYYIFRRGCKFSKCRPSDNCCKRVAAYLYSIAETEEEALMQADNRTKRLRIPKKIGFESSTDNSKEIEEPSMKKVRKLNSEMRRENSNKVAEKYHQKSASGYREPLKIIKETPLLNEINLGSPESRSNLNTKIPVVALSPLIFDNKSKSYKEINQSADLLPIPCPQNIPKPHPDRQKPKSSVNKKIEKKRDSINSDDDWGFPEHIKFDSKETLLPRSLLKKTARKSNIPKLKYCLDSDSDSDRSFEVKVSQLKLERKKNALSIFSSSQSILSTEKRAFKIKVSEVQFVPEKNILSTSSFSQSILFTKKRAFKIKVSELQFDPEENTSFTFSFS